MADLVLLASSTGSASLVDPEMSEAYDFETTVSLKAGDAVSIDTTNGRAIAGSAAAAGTAQFRGIVTGKSHGRGKTVLMRGRFHGFNLSTLDFGDTVYLSDTAGKLADTAGTVSVPVGTVMSISKHGAPVKCLMIDAQVSEAYA